MGERHIFSDWFLYDQGLEEEEAETDDGSDEPVDEGDSSADASRVVRKASLDENPSVPDGR